MQGRPLANGGVEILKTGAMLRDPLKAGYGGSIGILYWYTGFRDIQGLGLGIFLHLFGVRDSLFTRKVSFLLPGVLWAKKRNGPSLVLVEAIRHVDYVCLTLANRPDSIRFNFEGVALQFYATVGL